MSDRWIVFVPTDPGRVPEAADRQAAFMAFRSFAPDADEMTVTQHEGIELFDCGANSEAVTCPHCQGELDPGWWSDRLSDDYIAADATVLGTLLSRPGCLLRGAFDWRAGKIRRGFLSSAYRLPCCRRKSTTLDALEYRWPQAFGRFGLSGRNCNIGQVLDNQVAAIGAALKCDVTVVCQQV